jgi:hypothetical protein
MDERNRHEAAEAWVASAHAYIQLQDDGDPNRTILLDPVMLAQCGDVAASECSISAAARDGSAGCWQRGGRV